MLAAELDVVEFAAWIRPRLRIVLISCTVAAVLAAFISFLMPRRYTATAGILIGTPAGLDPRSATSVSPVYLESLRTYEHLANSDSLFLKALEHIGLEKLSAGRSIEGLKGAVLRVSKPLNTRIINISATLEDPAKAQALAQYIAEQTVALSRSIDSQLSGDLSKEAIANFNAADAGLRKAQAASEQFAKMPGTEGLTAELEGSRELKFAVERDLGSARAALADLSAQPAAPSGQIAALKARIATLEIQDQTLRRTISADDAQLEKLSQQREAVASELTEARDEFESAKSKLTDIKAAASFHGERLDLFDPGIVPRRPSSPNIPLNVVAAVLIAAVVTLGFLTFRYGYARRREF